MSLSIQLDHSDDARQFRLNHELMPVLVRARERKSGSENDEKFVYLPTVDVRYFASIELGSAGGRRPEFDRFIFTSRTKTIEWKKILFDFFLTSICHACLLASLSYGQNKKIL